MTQSPGYPPQPPHDSQPPQHPNQPYDQPAAPTPNNSRKLLFVAIVAAALVVAIVAIVGIALLTRDSGGAEPTAAPGSASSSAAPTSAADTQERYALRGNLTSKPSVCAATGVFGQQVPKFPEPINFDEQGFDTKIEDARQQLERLALRISPNTAAPLGPTVQDWINAYGEFLDGLSSREGGENYTWKSGLTNRLAGQINGICNAN